MIWRREEKLHCFYTRDKGRWTFTFRSTKTHTRKTAQAAEWVKAAESSFCVKIKATKAESEDRRPNCTEKDTLGNGNGGQGRGSNFTHVENIKSDSGLR